MVSSAICSRFKILAILFLLLFGFSLLMLLISSNFDAGTANSTETMPRPYLWSVQHPNTTATSYLFGTIHLRHDMVMNYVPNWDQVQELFNNADVAVFENNVFNYSDSAYSDVHFCCFAPTKITAKFLISTTTLDRVKKVIENVPARTKGIFKRFGPPSNMSPCFLLTELEEAFNNLDLDQYDETQNVSNSTTPRPLFLDASMMRNASARGQEQRFVETVREVCDDVLYLPVDSPVEPKYLTFVINSKLDKLEKQLKDNDTFGETFSMLIHYANDSPELEKMYRKSSTVYNKLFIDKILIKRNRRWLPQMNAWMQKESEKTFFFAFGVGHFIGEANVVQLLEEMGYVVRRLGGKEDAIDVE